MTTVRHVSQCCSLCYSFSFGHKCPGLVGSRSRLQSYVSYTLVCVHFIVCSMYVCSCSTPSFSSPANPVLQIQLSLSNSFPPHLTFDYALSPLLLYVNTPLQCTDFWLYPFYEC